MFSSLLPKPKHTAYSKPIRLEQDKVGDSKVLVLPSKSDQLRVVTKENEDPFANNSTISKYYLNKDGTLNYNVTIASSNTNGRFHSSYEDTIPLKKRFPNLKHNFPKYNSSNPEQAIRCVEETQKLINKLIGQQTGEDKPQSDIEYATYTSRPVIGGADEERGRETQIQIKNYQVDPMLPPKHKLRKNRHKEPSPPPPILKNTSAEAKLTKEDHAKWNIPASISNWKNNQGFTISLDKRMLAATSNEAPSINVEKLSGLTSALDDADRQAREDIRERNEIRKQMAERQQREKEQKLRELAEASRRQNSQRDSHRKRGHDSYDNNDYKKSKY